MKNGFLDSEDEDNLLALLLNSQSKEDKELTQKMVVNINEMFKKYFSEDKNFNASYVFLALRYIASSILTTAINEEHIIIKKRKL